MSEENTYYVTTENKDGHTSVTNLGSEENFHDWYNRKMTHLSETRNSDVYQILYRGNDEKKAIAARDRRRTIKPNHDEEDDDDLEDIVEE